MSFERGGDFFEAGAGNFKEAYFYAVFKFTVRKKFSPRGEDNVYAGGDYEIRTVV